MKHDNSMCLHCPSSVHLVSCPSYESHVSNILIHGHAVTTAMDILRANCAKLLPESVSSYRERREVQLRQDSTTIYEDFDRGTITGSFHFVMISERETVLTCDVDLPDGHVQCSDGFLKAILDDLTMIETHIILSNVSYASDTSRLYLEQIDAEVDRLEAHPTLIREELRRDFFIRVNDTIGTIIETIEMWKSMKSELENIERTGAGPAAVVPATIPANAVFSPWKGCSSNRVAPRSEEDIAKAAAAGRRLAIRQHYLNRGGHTILEHWRNDVNGLVMPLLQLNDCEMLRSQEAGQVSSYNHQIYDATTGKTKVLMETVPIAHAPKYTPIQPFFVQERISSTASFLERICGMTILTGPVFPSIMLRTFMDEEELKKTKAAFPYYVRSIGQNL